MRVLQAVEEVNENQKSLLFDKLVKQYNGNLEGKTVCQLGPMQVLRAYHLFPV